MASESALYMASVTGLYNIYGSRTCFTYQNLLYIIYMASEFVLYFDFYLSGLACIEGLRKYLKET